MSPGMVGNANLKFQLEAIWKGKGVQDAISSLDKLAAKGRIAGLALMGAGMAGGAFLLKATQLAARVETLGVVVQNMGTRAGYTTTQLKEFEKAIAAQGITTQATRQSMAMLIQADLDLAKASDLARVAQDSAVIANVNSSESFQRLVYIIQTGNTVMGRSLGLQLDFAGAMKREADQIGINVQSMDNKQKLQARMNEVLRQGITIQGSYSSAMETAGKKSLSLERLMEQAQLSIGQAFLPAFGKAIDTVSDLLKKFDALSEGQKRYVAVFLGVGVAIATLGGAVVVFVTTAGPMLTAFFVKLGIETAIATGGLTLLVGALAALIAHGVASGAATDVIADSIKELTAATHTGEKTYKDYITAAKEYGKANELLVVTQEQWNKGLQDGTYGVKELGRVVVLQTEAVWEAADAAAAWERASSADTFELNKAARASMEVTTALGYQDLVRRDSMSTHERHIASLSAEASVLGSVRTQAILTGGAIDTNLTGSISRFMDEMEFFMAGGYELQQQFEQIQAGILAGKITPEKGKEMMEGVYIAAQNIQVELGNITETKAAQNIRDELGIPFGEALEKIQNVDQILSNIEREYNITIKIHTEGIPNMLQHGGEGIVPPGYPNDTYPMLLSSGEHYKVTPSGGSVTHHRGGDRSITIENLNVGGSGGLQQQLQLEDALLRVLEDQV